MRVTMKLLPLLALVLAGCATTKQVAQPSTTEPASKPAAAKPGVMTAKNKREATPPSVSLTAELLNDLILADVAVRRGHFDLSVKLFLQTAQYTRDPRLAERAARIASYAEMQPQALEATNLWVELDPENSEARQLLTSLLVKGGKAGSAEDHLERILASEGETLDGFMTVAGLLSRERDKNIALDLMKKIVAKRDENADAHYAMSHLALRFEEYDLAESSVNRALALRGFWDAASLQYVRILVAQSKNAQAVEYLNSSIEKHPDNLDFRLFYARLLMDQERFPEAYDQFKFIADKQPDNEDALFALGFVGLQLNRLDEAEAYLLRLKKLGSRGYEVNYYLGRLEELRGNAPAARQWYTSIAQGEHYFNAQIRIIVLMSQDGDLSGALNLVQQLKRERPAQKLRLELVEGEILVEHGKYQEAMTLYTKALEEVPENQDLLYARSMVAEKLNDLASMERDMRLILSRDPNNVEALNGLGYTLADRTTRYQEAYELISRALELRPNDFFILDSMGWVKYKMGKHQEAIDYLRRALETRMDVEIAAHLGEVLWVTGEHAEARAVWQRALDQGDAKRSKIIHEVMKRLEK